MIFLLSFALCVDHLSIIPTERRIQQCTRQPPTWLLKATCKSWPSWLRVKVGQLCRLWNFLAEEDTFWGGKCFVSCIYRIKVNVDQYRRVGRKTKMCRWLKWWIEAGYVSYSYHTITYTWWWWLGKKVLNNWSWPPRQPGCRRPANRRPKNAPAGKMHLAIVAHGNKCAMKLVPKNFSLWL